MTTAAGTSRYSVSELQAAASALLEGRFSTQSSPHVPEARPGGADLNEVSRQLASALSPLVRVHAGCAGAGATTVVLGLADAAAARGLRTRVLDAAAPAWSGLLGATVTELGAAEGWRRGRRGHGVVIDRVDGDLTHASEVPLPRASERMDLTVLDTGWSARELIAATDASWICAVPAAVEVVVMRSTDVALRQAEAVLSHLKRRAHDSEVVLAVVGSTRWSMRELTAAGRLVRRAHERGAVVFVPAVPLKFLPSLGPDPLPKHLAEASQRLLEQVTNRSQKTKEITS